MVFHALLAFPGLLSRYTLYADSAGTASSAELEMG